ncbi:MAG TPA: PilZ domain-containing protein [Phycisphaerales bacterium]|nr:PilZ domain-containing protein [Phycisphaerales bacterium]
MFWEAANLNDPAKPAATDPRRKHGRLACCMATSTLGEVADVSAGGMRVRSSIRLEKGQRVVVTIATPRGPMPVQCTVMWVKRTKLFWYSLGLQFENLNEQGLRIVREFARAAADQEVVRPSVNTLIEEVKRAG